MGRKENTKRNPNGGSDQRIFSTEFQAEVLDHFKGIFNGFFAIRVNAI
ncbi:hypothetical protein ACFL2S_06485 [Thermodesulfobacteriota bacterium]